MLRRHPETFCRSFTGRMSRSELDRGSEDQKRWRAKVKALAAWALGPYREAFGNDTLTIATVTPDDIRQDQLRTWTSEELTRIGLPALAEIFLFTSVDPVETTPQRFYFGRCWYEPVAPEPVSLLIPPALPRSAVELESPVVKEVWHAGQ